MERNLIRVKAKLRLYTTLEGGRRTGIKPGYRPNHVFELPADGELLSSYDGDIQFECSELILPGETRTVTVRFLSPLVKPLLQQGIRWYIHEGPHRIGEGEVIEVQC